MIDLSKLTPEQIRAVFDGLTSLNEEQIAALRITTGGAPAAEPPRAGAGVIARIVPRVTIVPPRSHDDPNTPEDDRKPRLIAMEGEQVVFVDGTDHMHDGSIVSVEADYLDANGNGLRIDLDPAKTPPGERNHPELLGMIEFRARNVQGGLAGSIGGTGLDSIAHFTGAVHWLDPSAARGIGAYRRSGGVWAQCVVRGEGEVYTIEVVAPGNVIGRVILPRIG